MTEVFRKTGEEPGERPTEIRFGDVVEVEGKEMGGKRRVVVIIMITPHRRGVDDFEAIEIDETKIRNHHPLFPGTYPPEDVIEFTEHWDLEKVLEYVERAMGYSDKRGFKRLQEKTLRQQEKKGLILTVPSQCK